MSITNEDVMKIFISNDLKKWKIEMWQCVLRNGFKCIKWEYAFVAFFIYISAVVVVEHEMYNIKKYSNSYEIFKLLMSILLLPLNNQLLLIYLAVLKIKFKFKNNIFFFLWRAKF